MWGIPVDLIVLVLAVLLDLAVGELPARFHPTVWIGRTVALTEKLAPKDGPAGVLAGGLLALLVAALWVAAAYFAARGLQGVHSAAYLLAGAVLLKPTFAVRMLHQAAAQVRDLLASGDIGGARQSLRSLVSRDPSHLTAAQTTSATVESVAENMADSFLGPWLFFALFGLPGAVAYRVINTLDSMIGYHGRYENLGKASARLDDLINLVPARLAGLLLVIGSSFLPGQRASSAWRIMWRDHARTESPNAGWAMSGMAGALGVELEKVSPENGYRLGDGTSALEPQDITRAVQSMYLVAAIGLLVALGLTYLRNGVF